MDMFNKLADKAKGAASGHQNTTGTAQQSSSTGATGQEDYGDKGIDAIEKKLGYSQSRETNEKITDGARGAFEKATGKHIDAKYSN